MENSRRFINAYNQIDTTLRNVYGYKANMTFTDIVRRSVTENYIIRKYEDDLVAYARLRNAIVHRSSEDMVIAEPHSDVVEQIEKIATLVSTPPTVIETLSCGKVMTISGSTKLVEAVKLIAKTHYSNIPVYEDGRMLGIINNKIIVECLGAVVTSGKMTADVFLNSTSVGSILKSAPFDTYYTIMPKSATLSAVLSAFLKSRRLLAVIVTKNGTNLDEALTIVTPSDIMQINNILDNYT